MRFEAIAEIIQKAKDAVQSTGSGTSVPCVRIHPIDFLELLEDLDRRSLTDVDVPEVWDGSKLELRLREVLILEDWGIK